MSDETPTNSPFSEDEPQSVEQMLQTLLSEQAHLRAEVAAQREELAKAKKPTIQRLDVFRTPEELLEERVADIRQHSHYCPGCGRLSNYPRECSGLSLAKPHPSIEMVSTEELLADDANAHTAAPDTADIG